MDETLATETATLPPAGPTLNPTFGSLLALGVTIEETTVCLLENVSGAYRLAGWATQQRTAGTSLAQPTVAVCQKLGRQLGRALWDEDANMPFLQSPDTLVYPPLEHVSIGISPQPRLRVWLVGLSSESLNVARQALISVPLQISGTTCLRPGLSSPQLATALADHQPEALVVVGGYDSPDADTHGWLLALCRLVGQALARLAPAERPTVFYAGNRWAATTALPLLQQGEGPLVLETIGNVLPHPNYPVYTELAVALSQLYWRQCQRAPGFAQLSRWATAPGHVANLESSFAQLVSIWMEYHGLPQLHGLYCTPHWWLHVWAEQATQGVQLRFVKPASRPQGFADWPPLQLVSGAWPVQLWATPLTAWWDRHALAPLITVVGQVAPQAMLQVLEEDILETRQRRIVAA